MPALPDVIVFDMDGVLVEVTDSYRETIRATVRHFTGEEVSQRLIQEFKNQGGWNNDWDLVSALIQIAASMSRTTKWCRNSTRSFSATTATG